MFETLCRAGLLHFHSTTDSAQEQTEILGLLTCNWKARTSARISLASIQAALPLVERSRHDQH